MSSGFPGTRSTRRPSAWSTRCHRCSRSACWRRSATRRPARTAIRSSRERASAASCSPTSSPAPSPGPAVRERGRGAPALPQAAGLHPGLDGTLETSGDDEVVLALRRRPPCGLAQRRRDGVGARRARSGAARPAARGAGPLQRPLRPLAAHRPSTRSRAADLAQAPVERLVLGRIWNSRRRTFASCSRHRGREGGEPALSQIPLADGVELSRPLDDLNRTHSPPPRRMSTAA